MTFGVEKKKMAITAVESGRCLRNIKVNQGNGENVNSRQQQTRDKPQISKIDSMTANAETLCLKGFFKKKINKKNKA